MRAAPTPRRVRAIIEHMESLGAYTQAEEIAALLEAYERLVHDRPKTDK